MLARSTGIVAICLASSLVIGAPAWGTPSGDYGPPARQCTITDPQVDELSGLAALPEADVLLVEDSTPEPQPGSTTILMYRLDAACAVQGSVSEFAQDPRDIEDLAFADNTIWFADIGDNGADRDTIALITVAYDPADPQAAVEAPQIFRLVYPDGPHDAEALLLAPDGIPYITTKDPLGQSGVYRPAAALDPAAEVLMEKVADLTFTMTGTPGGPVGRAGQLLVTGGSVSADGSRIALRTYTDAYVWALAGSDVAVALQAEPVAVIALPDAPQGEAIAFAPGSHNLLVGSEGVNSVITVIPDAAAGTDSAEPTAASETAAAPFTGSPTDSGAPAVTVVAGVIAAVVVTGLIWLVLRLRRRGS